MKSNHKEIADLKREPQLLVAILPTIVFFFFFCVCLLIMVLLCSLYTPIQRIIIIIHHTETLVRFDCSLRYESKWTKGALQMLLRIWITFF